ncbi:HAT transposon superfamily protein [Citrus sinensis]|uniref:HAT transposon superfamily protein n=2 Tax=Citrus sinensis TaxID=2711 RepID=A0ACB8K8R9_CITSI|nr:HAT transposon superfamily protein [Citrus sinensis]KAH9750791.1 HAT transposon superfamily protein [Citrus sinensis]
MGIDFSVANSPSFQDMINASRGKEKCEIPSCQDLKGWILHEEVMEMQEYVKRIRHSWESTGCSILLDGWTDENGRNLVSFIVDCPQGPIYLRSSDISAFVSNVDALQLLLDGVIEEVGVNNVVQIVACSTSGWMGDVGKQFMERRRTVFWTVSVFDCIALMLEKIGTIDFAREILEKAKTITKFIHGHTTVLKLFGDFTGKRNLIKPSKLRSAMPFLTLENIVAEKKNLKAMFASFEWNRTKWASRTEGKRIVNLVEDRSFWSTARMVLKATIPLVRVLCLINGAYKPQVGYIDETMDQAKETIKEEFKNKKTQYWPIWEIIDDKTLFPHIIIIRLCLMSDIADHLQCHTENRYKFL